MFPAIKNTITLILKNIFKDVKNVQNVQNVFYQVNNINFIFIK